MPAALIDAGQPCLPTLHAERVRLRMLYEADVPALLAVFGDAEVMRYWSRPPLADLAEAQAYLESIHAGFAERRLFQWGVALAGSDQVIGTATLYDLDPDNGRAGIGYALGRAHWGLGLAREAVAMLLGFAFDVLGLRRVEADVDPRNLRSCRMLERLGFRAEGLLRERWKVAGELQDSAIYGLLEREWREQGITTDAA